MQNIIFYVAANETLGTVRDYANAKNATAPVLVRGVEARLKMRIFAKSDGPEPYPVSAFENIVAWSWAMDNDFNEATSYKLVGDNADITVASITEIIDDEEYTYTEITIPMTQMNTEELAMWLGTQKSMSGLAGELVGYDAAGRQIFILQVENFTVRNRITSLGTPTEAVQDYLTAAQVRALFAAGMECEFSEDGENWHSVQAANDNYVHMRLRGESQGVWSNSIILMSGPRGYTGRDSFCYVAYASNAAGANFSLEPANHLKYRAEIHTDTEIVAPAASDFVGARWIKYCGDDGQGVGDMVASVYDPDGDGKVLAAGEADHAGSADTIPWNGVTGKPESFPTAAHTHSMIDIVNPVYQKVYSASNPRILYLDSPIVRNTSGNSSGTVELNFTGIQTRYNGENVSLTESQMLTWEYHVLCTANVTGVSVGSENCSMVGINIPETLPLINGNYTYHVFVVRAVYRSGVVNNVRFQANYAYSYEA